MTDRITADILVEAFDLALPDFDDLKDRIEEAAAAHKATLTVDGRRYPAAATPVPPPAERAAALTEAERTMLTYALDQAQEKIWSEDGFTDEDQAAVDSLRRLAAEAQPTARPEADDYERTTGHLITCLAVAGGGAAPDCPCAAGARQDGAQP